MSWLSDLFGGAEKKAKQAADERAATLQAQNTALINSQAKPFKSLTEIPVGKSLNDTILAALTQGTGIGYGPDFVSRATNAPIASRETRFTQEEMPYLSSEMGARGLSRSSIAGSAIGRATTAKEQDINQLIANAYLANEQQKKLDQARYESEGMQWTGAEAGQNATYAGVDASRIANLVNLNKGYESDYNTRQSAYDTSSQNLNNQIAGAALNVLGTALAPVTGGTSLAISQALSQALEAKKATAFTKAIPTQ